EVKRRSADGSVGSPHARVGNCQASNKAKGHPEGWPFCAGEEKAPDAMLAPLIQLTKVPRRGEAPCMPGSTMNTPPGLAHFHTFSLPEIYPEDPQ
ncbi:hypothetical protein, partial [Escherichia coli]|uniref:hypothetical protein n=1 Tax=Escherichia coli TaxID=562 RepID=UPI003B976BAA